MVKKDHAWANNGMNPKCSKSGLASLSQPPDSMVPAVEGVPDGFKTLLTEFGPLFECAACGVPVEP